MAWVRIHDGAMTHPKVLRLNDRAFRLWVWGLTYAQQHLTDGWLPALAIPGALIKGIKDVIAVNLWAAVDTGYQIHDYLDWNDSRETVTKKRTEAKDRMAAARGRSLDVRVNKRPNDSRTSTEVLRGSGNSSSGSTKEKIEENDDPHVLERVMDAFRAHWKRAYGFESSLLLKPLELMQLEQQLAALGEARLLTAMAAYFATEDPYVRNAKHPLPLFLRDPSKHLAGAAKAGPQRPRGCKHEPACVDDAAHTRRDLADRRAS